jgi:hypothetical protein
VNAFKQRVARESGLTTTRDSEEVSFDLHPQETQTMRNVQKIIATLGGMAALKSRPIRLEVPGFMRLVIEHVGTGPRAGELVSVAHYGEQNGDAMRDPEIVFELAAGEWHPVSIQQDYIGSYREAVSIGEDGRVNIRPAEVRDIQVFARLWDRNLKVEGFVDAAKGA